MSPILNCNRPSSRKERAFGLVHSVAWEDRLSPRIVLRTSASPASRNEVEDQHDHGDYENEVDQSAAYVECEAQEPQHQEDYEDCPEHMPLLSGLRAPGS